MHKIGVVINPYSKLNKNNISFISQFKELFQDKALIRITNSIEDIYAVAQEYIDNQIDILAINGGDGTISQTLKIFYTKYSQFKLSLPKIALLKGGTINVLASNLNIKESNPIKIFDKLINKIKYNQEIIIKTYISLCVEEKNIGFLFADGVAYNFLKTFYQNKTNALGSIALLSRVILSYLVGGQLAQNILTQTQYLIIPKPYSKIFKKSMMLSVMTIDKFPFGVPLFSKNSNIIQRKSCPLKFCAICISPHFILSKLPFILLPHKEGERWGKICLNCSEIEINIAKSPDCFYNYSLDGELYQTKSNTLLIKRGPHFDFILL